MNNNWWDKLEKKYEEFKSNPGVGRSKPPMVNFNELHEREVKDAYSQGYSDGRQGMIDEASAIIATANESVKPSTLADNFGVDEQYKCEKKDRWL